MISALKGQNMVRIISDAEMSFKLGGGTQKNDIAIRINNEDKQLFMVFIIILNQFILN